MALLTSGLLLLAADGQGDGGCDASGYGYPDNIKVLLDSWRYQTLLSHNGDSSVAFWHTEVTTDVSTIGSHYTIVNIEVVCFMTVVFSRNMWEWFNITVF